MSISKQNQIIYPALKKLEEDDSPRILYPDIYNITQLLIDKSLPMVQIKSKEKSKNRAKLNIEVEIPSGVTKADLFLFVNQLKKDMYYQVNSGSYIFKNIKLEEGNNQIEFFYRIGRKRSPSAYLRAN